MEKQIDFKDGYYIMSNYLIDLYDDMDEKFDSSGIVGNVIGGIEIWPETGRPFDDYRVNDWKESITSHFGEMKDHFSISQCYTIMEDFILRIAKELNQKDMYEFLEIIKASRKKEERYTHWINLANTWI